MSAKNVLLWIARGSATAVIIPLMLMLAGDGNTPMQSEWLYLALFPGGFSLSYVAGWRWPRAGGLASLLCMGLSLLVATALLNTRIESTALTIWAMVCIPGVLYIVGGSMGSQKTADHTSAPPEEDSP